MLNHKGLAKDHLGQVPASLAGSTNQILIEDIWQEVIKVIKSIKSTSGKISIKATTKNSGEKHVYVQGVGWVTTEVDKRENSRPVTSLGHQEGRRVFWEGPKFFELCPIFLNYVQHNFLGRAKNFLGGIGPPAPPWLRTWKIVVSAQYYRMWQAYETKINWKSSEIAGLFIFFCQMNKAKTISNFPECYTKFSDQHTLKKADPEMFSFWVNNIFANKQILFDICGLMQSQQSIYQSD